MRTYLAVLAASLFCASSLSAQTSMPCAAPVGTTAPTPTVSALTPNMTISWTAVRGAIGYGVARKNPDGTCWNITPQLTTSTSVQEPIPTTAGTYQYQVGVRYSTGYALSQWGSYDVVLAREILQRPPDLSAPTVMNDGPKPAYLNVTGTPTTANLTWAPVTGAVSYNAVLYVAGVAGAALTTLSPAGFTGTSLANVTIPDPTQTYTYRVSAYQKDSHFGEAFADFKAPPPTNPTSLNGTASGTTVTLSWQPVQYAARYLVSGPGISSPQYVNGTSYSFTAPTGTNTYKVGSVFDPGALSTASSAFPSVTVPVYAPVATCACKKTGDFTEPSFQQVSGSAQSGSFSSTAGTFTVTVTATTIDVTDPSGRNKVLSEPLPAAWGYSPTGDHFFLAAKPQSMGGPSEVVVYPVKVGPQKWRSVVSTSLAADGLWGFSSDGSMFITRRYVQARFIVQAYNLLSSTPQSAVLNIDETNAFAAFVKTSPCGDRLWFWHPALGEGHFYRRTIFPAKTPEVVTDGDGSGQTPSSTIISPATNVFMVQLAAHNARPGATSTISSLQCTP